MRGVSNIKIERHPVRSCYTPQMSCLCIPQLTQDPDSRRDFYIETHKRPDLILRCRSLYHWENVYMHKCPKLLLFQLTTRSMHF